MKFLEIILVTIIIGIFATIVTPRLANMVDTVMLDREIKRLGSEISLLQSMSKVSDYDTSIFTYNLSSPELSLSIQKNKYGIVDDKHKYINGVHNLPSGFEIACDLNGSNELQFNKSSNALKGNSGHITLTSKLNHQRFIIIDSVGRWRISLTEPD